MKTEINIDHETLVVMAQEYFDRRTIPSYKPTVLRVEINKVTQASDSAKATIYTELKAKEGEE